MPFRFEWRDQSKRAMCYVAEGDWNWKDYHQAVRASAFTLMSAEYFVDSLIDVRGSARSNLPAGASAHVRSFGRVTQARLTGRAAVIGIPAAELSSLQLRSDASLQTADGLVKFVEGEAELDSLLEVWAATPPEP